MNKIGNILSGDDLSQQRIILDKIKEMPNCFVGWVQSYNAEQNTISVQPAIQSLRDFVDQPITRHENKPLLVNIPIICNCLVRRPQLGDKAICFVLDQSSYRFFNSAYNANLPLTQQTFLPTSKAYKSKNDICAILIGQAEYTENTDQVIGKYQSNKYLHRLTIKGDFNLQSAVQIGQISDLQFIVDIRSILSYNDITHSGQSYVDIYVDESNGKIYANATGEIQSEVSLTAIIEYVA